MPPVKINLIAAQSKTGKTTILENLLPVLKQRGLKVAALKGNPAHYDLDLPGKDSWRFARAGAEIAGFTTPDRFLLVGAGGADAAWEMLRDMDLVLIEGNKKSKNPKIEVVRGDLNQKPLLLDNTVAVVTDFEDLDPGIPVFHIDNSSGLADFIIRNFFSSKAESAPAGADLTHFDSSGRPRMVDVSDKKETLREAYARGEIIMAPDTISRIIAGRMAKGDVLGVAQVAAVMAVKETGRLIPMAHPLGISGVEVDFKPVESESKIEIGVRVKLKGPTGVEMEALTGVGVAALTIYDMCKTVDKNMIIQNIRLVEKKGGRSGYYSRGQS